MSTNNFFYGALYGPIGGGSGSGGRRGRGFRLRGGRNNYYNTRSKFLFLFIKYNIIIFDLNNN